MWLTAGRLLIAQGAVDACKVGTSIAIRYSCKRPQFGEKMIMEYITQQRRLLPGLATTYAMQLSMARLRVSCCPQAVCAYLAECQSASQHVKLSTRDSVMRDFPKMQSCLHRHMYVQQS